MRNFEPLLIILISLKSLAFVCASPERSFFEFNLNKVFIWHFFGVDIFFINILLISQDDNDISIPITLTKETSVIVTSEFRGFLRFFIKLTFFYIFFSSLWINKQYERLVWSLDDTSVIFCLQGNWNFYTHKILINWHWCFFMFIVLVNIKYTFTERICHNLVSKFMILNFF